MKRASIKDRAEIHTATSPTNEAQEFIANSTAHGFKPIFDKEKSIVRRTFWTVLFTGSVLTMGYMLYASYLDIAGQPFITVSSLNLTSPMTFPALTLCNVNSIDIDNGDSLDVKKPIRGLHGNLSDSLMKFFPYCGYAGTVVNCGDIFHSFYQQKRRCYRLAVEKIPEATGRTILELIINVNQKCYIGDTESAGVMFHVHNPSIKKPDMTKPRYEAPTGFTTNVGIRVKEYQYLPAPYKAYGDSSCTDTESAAFTLLMNGDPELYPGSNGSSYSLDSCLDGRGNERTTAICNCTITGKHSVYPACRLEDVTKCYTDTYARVLDAAMASDLLGCPRECHSYSYQTGLLFIFLFLFLCPRECHSYSYQVTISSSRFPATEALDNLRKNKNVKGKNLSSIREDYLQLKFYMEDVVIAKVSHVPQYEWSSVMGLMGGNMGFFLGASVLTLAELLDFLVCVLLRCCHRVCYWRTTSPRIACATSGLEGQQKKSSPRKEAW